MRILIIHSTPWNDDIYGNNVLTNWFEGMDVELANIYRGAGAPKNRCCSRYFQITDKMIIKSFLGGKAAGIAFNRSIEEQQCVASMPARQSSKIKKFSCEFTQFCRSLVWSCARIDKRALKKFIEDFSPDVVFTCRKASLATLRLERIVHKYTNAPFVAFTGDDEYSLSQFRFDPFFWLERFLVRAKLRKNVKFYQRYLTLSEAQAEEYSRLFKIQTGVLRKCFSLQIYNPEKQIQEPIKLVYAGKLYCRRWKTLASISRAITKINETEKRQVFSLSIYAVGEISAKEEKAICTSSAIKVLPAVKSNELWEIYRQSDIVLHVEAFDLRNRLDTRMSFSTKIIDCLGSGCAVMAICWEKQSGYVYLKEEDAAICVSQESEVYKELCKIANTPTLVKEYAQKANVCAQKNHSKEKVQEQLLEWFTV